MWTYTNRRGLCTTFIFSYILFVMVENLQCNAKRDTHGGTNMYPWQASLHHKNESGKNHRICSAAQISNNTVITAAHCIHNKSRTNLTVTFGNSSKHVNVKNIKNFNYYDASHVHDIAILFLRNDQIVPGDQRPIKVDHEELDIEYGDRVYFKSYKESKKGIVELQALNTCWFPHPGEHFCGRIISSGLYKGDSGGIIWIDKSGEELAIGIISYSDQPDCYIENCLFIFTKLKSYDITSHIKK